ncbi:hypothetical protein ABTM57_20910, partial [Acinetobacter baumannii]
AIMIFVYMSVCIAQLAMRQRETAPAPIRMWLHPWGSLLSFAAMGAVLVAMAFSAESRVVLISSLAVVALAWACSYIG